MSQRTPIQDNEHLVRDSWSKAVINTNSMGLNAAKARKAAVTEQQNELRESINEINTIKEEIVEIKQLLKSIINVKEVS
mgnify:FL=1|jgi:hypothetical protein